MSKNGLILLTPTSIAYTGTSASVSANGSVSFSACSELRLNGVFSADYDNYMVVMRSLGTTNTGPAVLARLSSSGSDSATNYTRQLIYGNGTSVTALRQAETSFRFGVTDSDLRSGLVAWLYGPFLAQPTAARGISVAGYGGPSLVDYANTHSNSTQYDGVNLFPAGGSITGRVAVYGMRK